jgi:hypothetical protein
MDSHGKISFKDSEGVQFLSAVREISIQGSSGWLSE